MARHGKYGANQPILVMSCYPTTKTSLYTEKNTNRYRSRLQSERTLIERESKIIKTGVTTCTTRCVSSSETSNTERSSMTIISSAIWAGKMETSCNFHPEAAHLSRHSDRISSLEIWTDWFHLIHYVITYNLLLATADFNQLNDPAQMSEVF